MLPIRANVQVRAASSTRAKWPRLLVLPPSSSITPTEKVFSMELWRILISQVPVAFIHYLLEAFALAAGAGLSLSNRQDLIISLAVVYV